MELQFLIQLILLLFVFARVFFVRFALYVHRASVI